MQRVTTVPSARMSLGRTLRVLWKSLGWSTLLGLLLMILSGAALKLDLKTLTTDQLHDLWSSFIWPVCVCLAVAYGKVASKGKPGTVAAAGLAGAMGAVLVNALRRDSPDFVDGLRLLLYPTLAWTVTRLEQGGHRTSSAAWRWLLLIVILPGVIVAVTKQSVLQGVAEMAFATGCALILHGQKIPLEATGGLGRIPGAPSPAPESATPAPPDDPSATYWDLAQKAYGLKTPGQADDRPYRDE